MQIVRTGTSLYLLKPGTRTDVEKKFVDRVPLENGISGWFHFIEAKRQEPAWLRALQPYLAGQVHYDTRGGLPAGIVLVERKDANYLMTFGHAWIQLDPLWLEPDFGRRVALNAIPPNKVLELNSEQVFARWHVARERSPKRPTSRISVWPWTETWLLHLRACHRIHCSGCRSRQHQP